MTIYFFIWLPSIRVQPRCWETSGRWTSSLSCLLTWSPDCELSSVEPWTSCSSCLSFSPAKQWSTRMHHVMQLWQVLQVEPNICLWFESDFCTWLNVLNPMLEKGGMYNFYLFIRCLQVMKVFLIKSDVSSLVPPEDFPKMGYFHKSMPARTEVPPHKIPGASIFENISRFVMCLV